MYYNNKKSALYITIAQNISYDIARGIYQPGSYLKKQSEYAKEYETCCGTVKKAFALLKERGLVMPIKGHGTIVRGFHNIIDPHSGSFRADVERAYETCNTQVLRQSITYANPMLAEQLNIDVASPCYVVKLLRTISGQPICYQSIYLRYETAYEINLDQYDLTHLSLFSLYKQLGHSMELCADKSLQAMLCPPEICQHLLLKQTDPVLFIKSVLHCGQDIIEYNETYERTDLRPHAYRKNFDFKLSLL